MKKIMLLAITIFGLLTINHAQSTDNVQQQKTWREKIVAAAKMSCVLSPAFMGFLYIAEPRFKYSATLALMMNKGKSLEEAKRIVASQGSMTWPQRALACSLGMFALSLYDQFAEDIGSFLWNKLPSVA